MLNVYSLFTSVYEDASGVKSEIAVDDKCFVINVHI